MALGRGEDLVPAPFADEGPGMVAKQALARIQRVPGVPRSRCVRWRRLRGVDTCGDGVGCVETGGSVVGGEKARAKTSMPWRERGIRGAPLFASAFARAARTSSGDGSCASDVSRDIPSPVEARVARRDAPEPDAKLPGLLVQKSGQVGDVVTGDFVFRILSSHEQTVRWTSPR